MRRAARASGRPNPYAVHATIPALNARAAVADEADRPQIARIYAVVARLWPAPVIELNHTIAIALVEGLAKALDLLDSLAARAEMLSRLGRIIEADLAYRATLALSRLEPERRLLARRLTLLQR